VLQQLEAEGKDQGPRTAAEACGPLHHVVGNHRRSQHAEVLAEVVMTTLIKAMRGMAGRATCGFT
jgi:hypothetical protein